MLLVPTYLKDSAVGGIGCFAAAMIPKGTVVWRFEPMLDVALARSEHDALPMVAREYVDQYGFESDSFPGKIILDGDNARFFNHSRTPTIGDGEDASEDVALRDIQKGEELTEDYRSAYPGEQPREWL